MFKIAARMGGTIVNASLYFYEERKFTLPLGLASAVLSFRKGLLKIKTLFIREDFS